MRKLLKQASVRQSLLLLARQRGKLGFTLIELMISAVVIAVIASVVFVGYNRYRSSEYLNGKTRDMNFLLGTLESVRVINAGAYPAGSNIDLTIPSNPAPTGTAQLLAASLGTDNAEYQGWLYSCTGNTLSITVNVGDTSNQNLRVAVNRTLHNNLAGLGWDCQGAAYAGGPTFTCTKTAVCR